jgi:hypothetical protein
VSPETQDPGGDPVDDAELGTPIAELRDLSWTVDAHFGDKVRRRIERRLLGGQILDLAWTAPLTMLLEFLRASFELLSGRRPK